MGYKGIKEALFFGNTLLVIEDLPREIGIELNGREGAGGKRDVQHWTLHNFVEWCFNLKSLQQNGEIVITLLQSGCLGFQRSGTH